MTEPVLVVKDLCKATRKQMIVGDISFTVHAGELFGLIGANGSGKTTVLRMLVGLNRPTKGSVHIMGHSITKECRAAMRCVGCMVEIPPPAYSYLTGEENLELIRRMSPRIPQERIAEVAEQVRMTSYMKDKVRTYSLGMRQRLGIAQALLPDPKLLILDEPTNGLDPQGICELRDLLQKLAQEKGVAVLLATHLLHEAERLCHRVGILHRKRLSYVGPTRMQGTSDSQQVIWQVQPLDRAIGIAKDCPTVGEVSESPPEGMVVTMDADVVPMLTKLLVEQEVQVRGVQVSSGPTLEERFIAETLKDDSKRFVLS